MENSTKATKEVVLRLTLSEASFAQAAVMTVFDSAPEIAKGALLPLLKKFKEAMPA